MKNRKAVNGLATREAATSDAAPGSFDSGITCRRDDSVTFKGKAFSELKKYAEESNMPMDKFLGLCLWCSLRDTAKTAVGFRQLGIINKVEPKAPGVNRGSSELDVVYEFDFYAKSAPGPRLLLTDHAGGWYLGDEGKPARQVTIAEALEWYAGQESVTVEGTGDIGPLIRAAAQQLRGGLGADELLPRTGVPVKIPSRPGSGASAQEMDAWEKAKREAFRARREVELTIPVKVGLFSWGLLSEAAIVHGTTPEKALGLFIESSDELVEWGNAGFPLVDEKEGFDR